MTEKVRSYYCEVCGEQRKFSKSAPKRGKGMMGRAVRESNPLMAAAGGMFKAGGAAMNATKSYRCAVCGSKKGAKPAAT